MILSFFQFFFNNTTFQVILGSPLVLIVLDILTGTFSASKQKSFDPKKLAAFMGKGGLWYIVGLGIVLLVSTNFGNVLFTALTSLATMAPLLYSTGASILENVLEMLPQPIGSVASTVVQDVDQFVQQVGAPVQPPVRLAQPVSLAGPGSPVIADPAPVALAPIDQVITNVMPVMPASFAYIQQPRA